MDIHQMTSSSILIIIGSAQLLSADGLRYYSDSMMVKASFSYHNYNQMIIMLSDDIRRKVQASFSNHSYNRQCTDISDCYLSPSVSEQLYHELC